MSLLPSTRFSPGKARRRIVGGAALFALLLTAIAARVTLLAFAPERVIVPRVAVAAPERADIVDANGMVLATTLKTPSVYADPKLVEDPGRAAMRLAPLLGLEPTELAKKLTSKKRFVWIKRHIERSLANRILGLELPGIFSREEKRRIYPQRNSAAHVVGFTDIDLKGLAGIEQYFDHRLRAEPDKPLRLSIDIRLQHILMDELKKGMEKWQAKAAAGVMIKAENNEVAALVSLPDFDPNRPAFADPQSLFNHASLGVYEMGSPFKLFTAALALESATFTMDSRFDVAKPLAVGRYRIRDFRLNNRTLTLPQVLQYSSNIGAAQMALAAGNGEKQAEFLSRFGILEPLKVELERASPSLPRRWRRTEVATIAYGHGLAVTPLHLAAAVGALVNGGVFYQPSLVKGEKEMRLGWRAVSPETSAEIISMMRLVVEAGSGRNGRVEGIAVGGKTGTAIKVGADGKYDRDSVLTSFVAAFPLGAKAQYVALVMLDRPRHPEPSEAIQQGLLSRASLARASLSRPTKPLPPITGGLVAAPIAGAVIRRSAAVMGISSSTTSPAAISPAAISPSTISPGGKPSLNASAKTPAGGTNASFPTP